MKNVWRVFVVLRRLEGRKSPQRFHVAKVRAREEAKDKSFSSEKRKNTSWKVTELERCFLCNFPTFFLLFFASPWPHKQHRCVFEFRTITRGKMLNRGKVKMKWKTTIKWNVGKSQREKGLMAVESSWCRNIPQTPALKENSISLEKTSPPAQKNKLCLHKEAGRQSELREKQENVNMIITFSIEATGWKKKRKWNLFLLGGLFSREKEKRRMKSNV